MSRSGAAVTNLALFSGDSLAITQLVMNSIGRRKDVLNVTKFLDGLNSSDNNRIQNSESSPRPTDSSAALNHHQSDHHHTQPPPPRIIAPLRPESPDTALGAPGDTSTSGAADDPGFIGPVKPRLPWMLKDEGS
ncbi:hypothetical protein BZA77DRAFT_355094 [Pyronema omphalodes]|nr:hypothetical protein BZA77DRAFT_355094 [Pyronema omphalodes]